MPDDPTAAELAGIRAKQTELYRRVQAAEKAMRDIQNCNDKLASGAAWCGGNLGRAFLAYGAARDKETIAELRAALADRDRQLAELREACQPLADAWRVYISESGISVALTTFRLMVHAEPLRRLAALLPDPTAKEDDRGETK